MKFSIICWTKHCDVDNCTTLFLKFNLSIKNVFLIFPSLTVSDVKHFVNNDSGDLSFSTNRVKKKKFGKLFVILNLKSSFQNFFFFYFEFSNSQNLDNTCRTCFLLFPTYVCIRNGTHGLFFFFFPPVQFDKC